MWVILGDAKFYIVKQRSAYRAQYDLGNALTIIALFYLSSALIRMFNKNDL